MALMNRGKYRDLFFSRLPMIDELMMARWNANEPLFTKVFNVRTSGRAFEEITGLTGFGLFSAKAEGDNVDYDTIFQAANKRYIHLTFAKGFAVSKETMDDDLDGILTKAAPELSRSAITTVEYYAWDVLNNGFKAGGGATGSSNSNTPDGAQLFSDAHVLYGPEGITPTSNLGSSDLAVGTLETALNTFGTMIDDRGLLIALKPRQLVVPVASQWLATELLKSQLRSDTTDNAVNAFNQVGLDIVVSPFISDSDAWFVFADKSDHRLLFYWREQPTSDSAIDFDSGNMKSKMTFRCVAGAGDWRGCYGSYGA